MASVFEKNIPDKEAQALKWGVLGQKKIGGAGAMIFCDRILSLKQRAILVTRQEVDVRAMLPALSGQYILLMKSTTLGIAIGFSEFFFVISTSINQSGQTIELLGLLMAGCWL